VIEQWARLIAVIKSFFKHVASDKEKQKKMKKWKVASGGGPFVLGVMSGAATHDFYKVLDTLYGVLILVLPPRWGRTCGTQTVVKGDIDDSSSITYDDSLTNFFPLLWEVASNAVYHNDLDDLLVEVMNYFTDELHMF
jgi:hypothetical protein